MKNNINELHIPNRYLFNDREKNLLIVFHPNLTNNELAQAVNSKKWEVERDLRIIYNKVGVKNRKQLWETIKMWTLTPLEIAEKEWNKIKSKVKLQDRFSINLARSYWNKAWIRADKVYNKNITGESV